MTRGRPFGSMRVLPSGRIQVRYYGPDGLRHRAPMTFGTRTEARRWLSMMEADLARGRWDGDDSEGEGLAIYAARWIRERPGLSERSVALYQGLLRLHIAPRLGEVGLGRITPAMVRTWRQELLDVRGGCKHGLEGIPAVAGCAEHGGRRRVDPSESMSDQGCRGGASCREAGADLAGGDGACRGHRAPVPDACSLGGLRITSLGRVDGFAEDGLRPESRPCSRGAGGVVGGCPSVDQEAEDCGRGPHGRAADVAVAGSGAALFGLLRADSGRPGVCRAEWCHAGATEFFLDLGSGVGRGEPCPASTFMICGMRATISLRSLELQRVS